MSRRTWTLASILGLLLCSGFSTLYFQVYVKARPPAISGTWQRGRHANESVEEYGSVSLDPNRLPAVLIFGDNGTFSVGDAGWISGLGVKPTHALFDGGTYTWIDPQRIKLTIGVAEAIYTIRIEPECEACNPYLDHLILYNEGGTFTFRRTELPGFEM
jgi:hypothetical protein